MLIIPNGNTETHFYFSEENNQFEKKKLRGKFEPINCASFVIDGSGSMGAKTIQWREYYYQLSQILGDNTQVMHTAIEGVVIYDNFRDKNIYILDAISGGEGYDFALKCTSHRIVIIIGDGFISDRTPNCEDRFVIYWNVDTNKNNTGIPDWADCGITNSVGSVNTQLKVLAATVKAANKLIYRRLNKTF